MNKMLQIVIAIILGSFAMYIFSSIANFFGISVQYYGIYMFFGLALGIFYFVLPNKPTNIFE